MAEGLRALHPAHKVTDKHLVWLRGTSSEILPLPDFWSCIPDYHGQLEIWILPWDPKRSERWERELPLLLSSFHIIYFVLLSPDSAGIYSPISFLFLLYGIPQRQKNWAPFECPTLFPLSTSYLNSKSVWDCSSALLASVHLIPKISDNWGIYGGKRNLRNFPLGQYIVWNVFVQLYDPHFEYQRLNIIKYDIPISLHIPSLIRSNLLLSPYPSTIPHRWMPGKPNKRSSTFYRQRLQFNITANSINLH